MDRIGTETLGSRAALAGVERDFVIVSNLSEEDGGRQQEERKKRRYTYSPCRRLIGKGDFRYEF